ASGLPALQLYSLATDKPIFERYAASTGWASWTAIVLALTLVPRVARAFGGWIPRVVAATAVVVGTALFAVGSGARLLDTQSWEPVVRAIEARARPGDAFLAQDVDQWRGEAHFDRLWLDRYARGLLPIAHAPWSPRLDLFRKGLALDELD